MPEHKPAGHRRAKHTQLSPTQVQRLVTESVAGSNDAFARLYEAYLPQIYYYCAKRLRNDDEAVEVVQDTFLAAFMKLDQLKNPRAFHSWIYSIAGAYVAGRQRRAAISSKHEQSLDVLTERVQKAAESESAGLAAEFLASDNAATSPETALDAKEEHIELISAIDALTDAQKEAVLLRYYAGLSVGEVAAAVGLSQNATLKRLHDARNMLRKTLGADEDKLAAALKAEEATRRTTATSGPGARVTLGIAGALPVLISGTGANSLLARQAPAFEQLARTINARPPLAPVLAQAVGRAAAPLTLRVAAGIVALALAGAGGYAIWRHNTADASQATTPAAARQAAETPAPAPASSSASAPGDRGPGDRGPGTLSQNAAAPTPAPAPAPQEPKAPAEPARPQITVANASLSYAAGSTPQTAAQLIAASGATARAAGGASLPVTLGGIDNIDWTRAGAYLCYLHATDSAGTGATTQVLSITIK